MRKLLLLFATISLFYSCDYYGNYNYEVSNQTSKRITIKYQEKYANSEQIEKTIKSGKTIHLIEYFGGRVGKNENPPNRYKDTLSDFGMLEVYIDNQKINKNFNLGKYWKFTEIGGRESTYTLFISDSLINSK